MVIGTDVNPPRSLTMYLTCAMSPVVLPTRLPPHKIGGIGQEIDEGSNISDSVRLILCIHQLHILLPGFSSCSSVTRRISS
jgi:hypothetical protein